MTAVTADFWIGSESARNVEAELMVSQWSDDFSDDFGPDYGGGMPLEALAGMAGTMFATDRWPPIEILGTPWSSRSLPAELVRTIVIDRTAPIETQAYQHTPPSVIEFLAGACADALSTNESTALLRTDCAPPVETSVAALVIGHRPSLEGASTAAREVASVAESLQKRIADVAAAGEGLATRRCDLFAGFEVVALCSRDLPVGGESISSCLVDGALPAESLVAALLLLVREAAGRTEIMAAIRTAPIAPVTSGGSVATDRPAPAEAALTIAQDVRTAAPIESLATLPLLPQRSDEYLRIEWSGTFRANPIGLAAWLATATIERNAQTEWMQRQIADPISNTYLQIEWRRSPQRRRKFVGRGGLLAVPQRIMIVEARNGLHSPKPFTPIAPGEVLNLAFDFTADVGTEASIASTSWACAVEAPWALTNPDPMPQSHVLAADVQSQIGTMGGPLYFPLPTDIVVPLQGQFSVAQIGNFLPSASGATYLMTATVLTSDGRTLSASADLPVR
jgi:hypothetical protein